MFLYIFNIFRKEKTMDKEYARRLLAGEIPMENPKLKKPGDFAYYYFDPRGVTKHTKFKDRKLIGVPTADTPNPALADSKLPLNKQGLYNIIKQTAENIGETVADAKIAYDMKRDMDNTGRKLVNKYSQGGGNDIDNYYHAKLQCYLSKMSPLSRKNGLIMGKLKEYAYDYPRKSNSLMGNLPKEELLADIEKDLQNNNYGSSVGTQKDACIKLLNHLRTGNMKNEGIY